MYITSELFGSATNQHISEHPNPYHRSNLQSTQQGGGLGKRKRQYAEAASCPHDSRSEAVCHLTHQIIPLSRTSPRHRSYETLPFQTQPNLTSSSYPTPSRYPNSERRPLKQMKRLGQKISLLKSPSHLMDIEPTFPSSVSNMESQSIACLDLRPCHACQSAPKRKRDLENYLDCRRCDERTCYICARQCYGGCGKAVCQKCTVEVGQEGDPWCLDCYSRNINS